MFVVLGVRDTDGVDLTEDGMFRAKYGYFSVETPLDNIDHTEITGPHRWYTAVGPRLSFADDGLTFGTNHTSGLCVVQEADPQGDRAQEPLGAVGQRRRPQRPGNRHRPMTATDTTCPAPQRS